MTKVIIWNNQDKAFKLTPWYIRILKLRGVDNPPKNVGDYDNTDLRLIEAVESARSRIPDMLSQARRLCREFKTMQSSFEIANDLFEDAFSRFWIKFISANPILLETQFAQSLYWTLMYNCDWEGLLNICQMNGYNSIPNMEEEFKTAIEKREYVRIKREQRDIKHDKYCSFCNQVGMRLFSLMPPFDGFKIIEYDETKFRAEITIKPSSLGFPYEELKLIPL